MRVKEAVTKVNMRTVREAGEAKKTLFTFSSASGPHLRLALLGDLLGAFGCSYLLPEMPTEVACGGGYYSIWEGLFRVQRMGIRIWSVNIDSYRWALHVHWSD